MKDGKRDYNWARDKRDKPQQMRDREPPDPCPTCRGSRIVADCQTGAGFVACPTCRSLAPSSFHVP